MGSALKSEYGLKQKDRIKKKEVTNEREDSFSKDH